MLNRYIWELYLNSGGTRVVELFRKNLEDELTEEYAEEIALMHKRYCPMEGLSNEIENQLKALAEEYRNIKNEADDAEMSEELYGDPLDDLYKQYEGDLGNPADIFADFAYMLPFYSTNLAILYPEEYVPYYYRLNYNVLQKIADTFDIELPTIPAKKEYKKRFFFYADVSRALISYGKENNLSQYELYAFLYDFAPKYIGGKDSYIIKDLPEPHSAYFIGASESDRYLYKNKDIIDLWQCSPETRAGDMIVMYIRTPVSAVNSIWRACSLGFNDPFFFYYRCVYISSPVGIKPFSLAEIKKDPVFKELPIVRKNMQGVNGVELKPSVYNYLVAKSGSQVNTLEYVETKCEGEYSREKDVEEKLIVPLIQKLGYREDDYKRQMYVEIGNHNNTLIPDFVLLPNERRGSASAFAIIEAKRSIPYKKKLEDVMVQAKSYAKLLTARYCVVAAQEKIWIAERRDNYDSFIFEASWEQLNDADVFFDLDKMLGK